mgnify:CR=1 FL=1
MVICVFGSPRRAVAATHSRQVLTFVARLVTPAHRNVASIFATSSDFSMG